MTIYFSAAIAQKAQFGEAYEEIVVALERLGHRVLQDTLEVSLHQAVNKTDKERMDYYRHVLKWISRADVVVLEVSFPSTLHIGHELSLCLEKGKPVIALYQAGYEPSFFLGLRHDQVFWEEYQISDLYKLLKQVLPEAYGAQNTRYNFYVTPPQLQYLEDQAKVSGITRSGIMRDLIEADMAKHSEFK